MGNKLPYSPGLIGSGKEGVGAFCLKDAEATSEGAGFGPIFLGAGGSAFAMLAAMRMLSCIVDEPFVGQTVEFVLRTKLFVSRRGVRHARHVPGGVLIDGVQCRTDATVALGQEVSICISDEHVATKVSQVNPEPGPLDVVFEDEDLIVVNKPAGLVMHPSRGHHDGTMINFLVHYLKRTGRSCNPHPVSRLDQGTTGLVIFTTSGYAQDRLQDQLHSPSFERAYLALCRGSFEYRSGLVDAPIGRVEDLPSSFDVTPDGKHAVTHYRVLATFDVEGEGSVSLVKLVLETGRTHQIRVHMKHLGHPLLGDAAYGSPSILIDRPCLHSWSVRAEHPVTRERFEVCAPLPPDMAALVPKVLRDVLPDGIFANE